MELVVDLADATVSVWLPDEFERLSVRVIAGAGDEGIARVPGEGTAPAGREGPEGALGALAAALSVHDLGTVDPAGEAHLDVAGLRALAGGDQPDNGWIAGFEAMVAGAAEHGWVDDDGALRAHVVWGD